MERTGAWATERTDCKECTQQCHVHAMQGTARQAMFSTGGMHLLLMGFSGFRHLRLVNALAMHTLPTEFVQLRTSRGAPVSVLHICGMWTNAEADQAAACLSGGCAAARAIMQ